MNNQQTQNNSTTVAAAAAIPQSKYLDLARKIKEIEMENAKLSVKLEKSNQHLFRLRLERNILMEKLEKVEPELSKIGETVVIKNEILKEMNSVVPEEVEED